MRRNASESMLPPFKILNINSTERCRGRIIAASAIDAKIYGGGTELLILLRHNLLQTDYLLNIKPIEELNTIRQVDGTVAIGASVTHRRLETDPTIRDMLPMLAGAESQVANIRVRSQGTLGGNLCFNDPHSDPATALLVHDASRDYPRTEWEQANCRCNGSCSACTRPRWSPMSCLCPLMFRVCRQSSAAAYLRIHRLQRPTLTSPRPLSRNGAMGEIRLAVGCVGPMA